MIRLSPQLRAGIQRSTLPALILLSGAMLVAGKTDQTMFETLRTGLSDVAAPVLDHSLRDVVPGERRVSTYERAEFENFLTIPVVQKVGSQQTEFNDSPGDVGTRYARKLRDLLLRHLTKSRCVSKEQCDGAASKAEV